VGGDEHTTRSARGLPYGTDARLSQRAAHENKFFYTRQADIGDELPFFRQQPVVFQTWHSKANTVVTQNCLSRRAP
jgi:hypothetical protein